MQSADETVGVLGPLPSLAHHFQALTDLSLVQAGLLHVWHTNEFSMLGPKHLGGNNMQTFMGIRLLVGEIGFLDR